MQRYDVIKFKELPFENIDKYVCVPTIWILWRDEPTGKVIVAYPVEAPSYTQNRVKKYELYSRNWKSYRAFSEYTISGYDEAETFIKYKNDKKIRETNELNKKRSCENPSTVQMQNVRHESQPSDGANETEIVVISSDDELVEPTELPQPAAAAAVILPPEYDPKSPRWALKYNLHNKGLIKLKPRGVPSGIYIDTRGYAKCFAESTGDNSLAVNLMMEIFTESALKVCTLSGRKTFGNLPRLYDDAVNVLMEFVLFHGFGDGDKKNIRKRLSKQLFKLKS